MDKTHYEPVIALFSIQLKQLLSYVQCILVTNHFLLLLIHRYIFTIKQIITDKEHLWYSFWSVAILPQKPWHHGHNNRKWLKQPQSHFHWAVPHKSCHFLLFRWMLCTNTPDISSSSENINIRPVFSGYLAVSDDYSFSFPILAYRRNLLQ